MFKTILFIAFFSIGVAAIGLSALVPDLKDYYEIKIKLDATNITNDKLQKLIDDHQEMLSRLHGDPNAAQRLAVVTLGFEPNQPNTAFPKPDRKTLIAAQNALKNTAPVEIPKSSMPDWLTRINNERYRLMLFLAGSGLILISFTCFSRKNENPEKS